MGNGESIEKGRETVCVCERRGEKGRNVDRVREGHL